MFSENIKRIRELKKIGVNELSRLSGVNASYISAMERGEKENPTINTLNKIADALGVPLDYLTRKSTKAIIEDRLDELNMTLEELSDKTKISVSYIERLDSIMPDEYDYQQVQKIANALNINSTDLLNSLARQEPPAYKGFMSTPEEDFADQLLTEKENPSSVWTKFDRELDVEKLKRDSEALDDAVDNAKKIAPALNTIPKEFTNPNEARAYINRHQIFGSNGFDADNLDDDEILQFANELLKQMEMVSYKYRK